MGKRRGVSEKWEMRLIGIGERLVGKREVGGKRKRVINEKRGISSKSERKIGGKRGISDKKGSLVIKERGGLMENGD